MNWFDKLTKRLQLWELRGQVEYWEKRVPELEEKLDTARWALSQYREELRQYDQTRTR